MPTRERRNLTQPTIVNALSVDPRRRTWSVVAVGKERFFTTHWPHLARSADKSQPLSVLRSGLRCFARDQFHP
jgi:hypothetical protein